MGRTYMGARVGLSLMMAGSSQVVMLPCRTWARTEGLSLSFGLPVML